MKTKHVHPVERRLDWVHEFKETLREYEIKDPEGYRKVTDSLEKVEWPWLCFEYGEDCYNDPIPAAKEFYEDVAKKGMNVQEKYTRKTPEQAKLEEARIAARDEERTKSEKQKNNKQTPKKDAIVPRQAKGAVLHHSATGGDNVLPKRHIH